MLILQTHLITCKFSSSPAQSITELKNKLSETQKVCIITALHNLTSIIQEKIDLAQFGREIDNQDLSEELSDLNVLKKTDYKNLCN